MEREQVIIFTPYVPKGYNSYIVQDSEDHVNGIQKQFHTLTLFTLIYNTLITFLYLYAYINACDNIGPKGHRLRIKRQSGRIAEQ